MVTAPKTRTKVVAIGVAAGVGLVLALGLLFVGYWLLPANTWERLTVMVGDNPRHTFARLHEIFPSRRVAASTQVQPLVGTPVPIRQTYRWKGEESSVLEFLHRTQTLGFLVLKDGEVVHELYAPGVSRDSLLTSWSVAKSFVSALIGIAIEEGQIGGVNDKVTDYLPQLTGTGYDGVTIKNILQMSSGIDFDENYANIFSDINRMFMEGFILGTGIGHYPAKFGRRAPPGTFRYISLDSQVLSMVLHKAVGVSVSEYLETKLWQPLGMEKDARWVTESDAPDSLEYGYCCLNATMRDYARFGQLYLTEGRLGEQPLIPAGWVRESVRPDRQELLLKDRYNPGWDIGYQYQWWAPAGDQGEFVAIGAWGQYIYVNPHRGVVIAKNSADPDYYERDQETVAVFRAF